jgi:hypothetical protein
MRLERGDVMRNIALAVAVLLESVTLLSVILNIALIPGQFYPNVASVAAFVLPSIVGLLCKRLDVALLLSVLPFWTLTVVYLARYAALWNVDLVQLSVLVQRVAAATLMLALLGAFGWLVGRVMLRLPAMSGARAKS